LRKFALTRVGGRRVGIEFGQDFPMLFELHRQRFIRQLKVRTDFFEKIALLLRLPFGKQNRGLFSL
jgi:hypothetical protein